MQATQKQATERQMAYIRQLRTEIGDTAPEPGEELTSAEASELIGKLVGMVKPSEPWNGNGHTSYSMRKGRINEPRLGMAMKECFKLTAGYGWDIDGQHRTAFIDKVVKTYLLFTEIAEVVESGLKPEAQAQPLVNPQAVETGFGKAQVA